MGNDEAAPSFISLFLFFNAYFYDYYYYLFYQLVKGGEIWAYFFVKTVEPTQKVTGVVTSLAELRCFSFIKTAFWDSASGQNHTLKTDIFYSVARSVPKAPAVRRQPPDHTVGWMGITSMWSGCWVSVRSLLNLTARPLTEQWLLVQMSRRFSRTVD